MEFSFYSWVIVPLLIFLARISDVTLGTLRFIFIARGQRKLAPILGFFEVFIWLMAAREVMTNLRNVACLIAYCSGFAMGSFMGIWLEEKLSLGYALFRAVLKNDASPLLVYMKERNLGYTIVEGEGTREKVKILFSIVKRKDLKPLVSFLSTLGSNTFYTIENVKSVSEGVFPSPERTVFSYLFNKHRKSK